MAYQLHRKERHLALKGKVLTFYRDTMVLPDGREEVWDFISHPTGGACVVPVLSDGRILLERQYRPSIDRETMELPAGARDAADADPQATAARELAEETGYACAGLRRLAHILTDVSWCDQPTDIYLAEGLIPLETRHLDPAEEIRLEPHTLRELLDMIYAGQLQDAKTVVGILAYANLPH